MTRIPRYIHLGIGVIMGSARNINSNGYRVNEVLIYTINFMVNYIFLSTIYNSHVTWDVPCTLVPCTIEGTQIVVNCYSVSIPCDACLFITENELSLAEAGFTIAAIRVRVLAWLTLGDLHQSWTIKPVNSSSPNVLQLPGTPVDQMIIFVQV